MQGPVVEEYQNWNSQSTYAHSRIPKDKNDLSRS